MEDQVKAGFWIRLVARALDGIIVTAFFALAYGLIKGDIPTDLTEGWRWQVVIVAYSTVLPVLWSGYVIGKKIFRINIRRYKDDQQVTFLNMFMREVIGYQLITVFTFGASIIVSSFMIALRKDKRGIHDIIGGTYVRKD